MRRAVSRMARETMNPDNNRRMFAATLWFWLFCIAMSMLRTA